MKKLITLITLSTLILVSCAVDKQLLSVDELKDWNVNSDTIFYKGKPAAIYDHYEYELNPSHGKASTPIQELSITQIDLLVPTDVLIRYIHTKHTKQKVEIVVPKRFK